MTKEQLKLLYKELDKQNSWGKNQIKQLILEIIAGIKE